MMKLIPLLAMGCLCLACASTTSNGYPPDFSVQYNAVSHLMRSETSVKVNGTTLVLHHKSAQSQLEIDSTFDLDPQEVNALYKVFKETEFHSMQSPKPTRVLDAPDESVTAVYDGKRSRIRLETTREIPQPILQCRQRVFELAAKYDQRMKSILGY